MRPSALSLALAIYFRPAPDEFRNGVALALEEFLAEREPNLCWYADEDLGRLRPATKKRLRRPVERLRSSKPMPFYAWTMFEGETYESAGATSCSGMVRDPLAWHVSMREIESRHLCFLRASFPVESAGDVAGRDRFLERLVRWAGQLPFVHGYGGLAINQPEATDVRQLQSKGVYEMARRHPGYEVDDCGGTVLVAGDAIKGVNWLTLISARFVERLGGAAALRGRFSGSIALHEVSGGLLIQAGPAPEAGDSEQGDLLPLYREVARALAPVRLATHPSLGPAELGSFGPEGTARWLRRFD